MKNTLKRAFSGAIACSLLVLSLPFASALEYHYSAGLYDNYFYTPTSSNHALDLDSKDDSGGSTIIVPSDSMGTDAEQTTPRAGSPVIPVGSYIDPWGSAVEKQIATDEKLNGLEGLSFNRLEGMGGGYTAPSQLVSTNGHFGAVSIGSRGIFAYVYPGATYESMKKGAGHVDGTSVWNGNVALCGHNRGSWPYFWQPEICAGWGCHYLQDLARYPHLPRRLCRTHPCYRYRCAEPHGRQPGHHAHLYRERTGLPALRDWTGNSIGGVIQ